MFLVRDMLDKQLVDRGGKPLGRIDGIVIRTEPGARPRVYAAELGPLVNARRLHPRIGRWVAAIARRLGQRRPRPYRIPWAKLTRRENDVKADVTAERTRAYSWERWLRAHVIGRIPGA